MIESDEIEDTSNIEITADDVQRRISDWLARLDDLLGSVKTWAGAHGWKWTDDALPMHEQMMIEFNLVPQNQPSLKLVGPAGDFVWIKPKGLWVIGANGRVDVYSPKGAFTLVDVAEPFEKPEWIIHHVGQGKGEVFTPDLIAQLV